MTEQEFDRRVENAASRFEQRVEGAADRLDKAVSRQWTHRPFRIVTRALSFAAGLGLLAGSFHLHETGSRVWSAICFWLGAAAIVCELLRWIFLRRR